MPILVPPSSPSWKPDVIPADQFSLRISISGGWLTLVQPNYRIGAQTGADSSTVFRRTEVSNAFVEGTFVTNALRDNVTETIEVYVKGVTTSGLRDAVDALTDALSQTQYTVELTIEDSLRRWYCYAADYSISTPVEFVHSRIALVTAQVPRDPTEDLVVV